MRTLLKVAATSLLIVGVATSGNSSLQIDAVKVNSGGLALPELTHFLAQSNPTVLSVSAKVKRGDILGSISIPVLKMNLPIYEGTETSQLKQGVGHFEKSVLPGIANNSVLSGHRDTVFSQLGKLKLGDLIVVNTIDGKFTYKIFNFRIVLADDRTVIVPTPTAVLTLSTCYPFRFIGHAPKRFIVSAEMVPGATPL